MVRPRTVVAACVLMFCFAGLAALSAATTVVTLADGVGPDDPSVLAHDIGQLILFIAATTGFTIAPLLVLQGRDSGRTTAFVITGTYGFIALGIAYRSAIGVLSPNRNLTFAIPFLAAALAVVAAATTVMLLSGNRTDRWFRDQCRDKHLNQDTDHPARPRTVTIAIILMGVITLAEAGSFALLSAGDAGGLMWSSPISVPTLTAAVVVLVLLLRNSAPGRIAAFGLCGSVCEYFVNGAADLISVFLGGGSATTAGGYYLRWTLDLTQACAAIGAIAALASRPATDWFRQRRDVRPTKNLLTKA